MKVPTLGQTIAPTFVTAPDGKRFVGLEYLPHREDEGHLVPSVLKNVWCSYGMDNEYRVDVATLGPTPVVLDLGANVGSFTMGIASAIPGARILSVEPSQLSYGCLVANILESNLQDRVVPARYAVGGHNDQCILVENLTGSCVIAFDELTHGYVFGGLIGAYRRTLPWLLAEYGIAEVDFMKVDIEGSEVPMILATPSDVLSRVKRIAMEIHSCPGEQDMIEHLRKTHTVVVHGYLFAERIAQGAA